MRARLSGRRSISILIVAIAILLLSGTMVVANHDFPDVPNSPASFHNAVSWLVDHGITSGCGGGKFCPKSAVTREQMALFMQRFHGITPTVDGVQIGDSFTTTSASEVDLPGAEVVVSNPSSTAAIVIMRFSAESRCSGGTGNSWCSVNFLVDGVDPADAVDDFAFDSSDGATEGTGSWESHAIERAALIGPGDHTIKVQVNAEFGGPSFAVDDWAFIVERFVL